MHEASIAEEIMAVVAQHVPEGDVSSVECVHVRVGAFSGVVKEALEFAWEMVVDGTALASATLVCESVPTRLTCDACGAETSIDAPPLLCDACGSVRVRVVDGADLSVQAITLRDRGEGA